MLFESLPLDQKPVHKKILILFKEIDGYIKLRQIFIELIQSKFLEVASNQQRLNSKTLSPQ